MELTPRELQVLEYLKSGKNIPNCAKELGIATATFKVYAKWVYIKMGVKTRLELMAKEIENRQ